MFWFINFSFKVILIVNKSLSKINRVPASKKPARKFFWVPMVLRNGQIFKDAYPWFRRIVL